MGPVAVVTQHNNTVKSQLKPFSTMTVGRLMLSMVLLVSTSGEVNAQAKKCNPSVCKLPDCFCSGIAVPGGLSPGEIPQIILIAFDGGVNGLYWKDFQSFFDGELRNPNDCNISATFFVSHEYTDYSMVQTLYHQRHEIADNSITRRQPISWWATANYTDLQQEIAGQKEILRKWGNINTDDVRGFSAPYLQVGGNTEFKVLKDSGFMYDSSMPTTKFIDPPLWPYTLDYRSTQECVIPPCPEDSFPGVWEVPLVDYIDLKNTPCSVIDACSPPANGDEAYKLLNDNFQRHYTTNRAPFPMFTRGVWFTEYSFTLDATKRFLKDALAKGDVWVVGISQAIEWIKAPTKLADVKTFKPWQCDGPAPPVCAAQAVNTCVYTDHTFRTCTTPCPTHYPWVGNPDGN